MTGLTAATDKVVFTHVGALRAKYGSTGVSRLRAALRTMISNDRGPAIMIGSAACSMPSARSLSRTTCRAGAGAANLESR